MKVWRLKKGADRRFRQGHPWIFASEVGHSIKEVEPGEVVELHDHQDHFLAFGYAHPGSQICFRRLSSRSADRDVLSTRYFIERLRVARDHRLRAGWASASHRWMFAEADGVPGLVVDAFLVPEGRWLIVVQASTAGIDRALPALYEALASFKTELGDIAIIEAPSSQSRKLEGLEVLQKRVVLGEAKGLENVAIRLSHGLSLRCDLLQGQKTGFFLDQQWNAGLLRAMLAWQFMGEKRVIRVLDICCYVGQWSAHVADALSEAGLKAQVTLADTSQTALTFASSNLQALGAEVQLAAGDALATVGGLGAGEFDVVICDPPAFVKKKADLAQGLQAYTKLNRDAMRTLKPGGLYVASSCSGLVGAEDWREVLLQAGSKAGRMFKQLASGGHAPDHPTRPEFPEGRYLKCEIGRIDYPY